MGKEERREVKRTCFSATCSQALNRAAFHLLSPFDLKTFPRRGQVPSGSGRSQAGPSHSRSASFLLITWISGHHVWSSEPFSPGALKLDTGHRKGLKWLFSQFSPDDTWQNMPGGVPGGAGSAGVMNPPASAGDIRDARVTPGSGGFPGGWRGNPLQYSGLDNPVDRGAWQPTIHRAATVHGVTKSQTGLSDWARMHATSPDAEKSIQYPEPS